MKSSTMMYVDHHKVRVLIVNFKNDFMCQGGFGERLGNDPSTLWHIIQPTKDVLNTARLAGVLVIHTREGHRSNLVDVTYLKVGNDTPIRSKGQMGNIWYVDSGEMI